MFGSFKPLKKVTKDGVVVKKETFKSESGIKINTITIQTKGHFKSSR